MHFRSFYPIGKLTSSHSRFTYSDCLSFYARFKAHNQSNPYETLDYKQSSDTRSLKFHCNKYVKSNFRYNKQVLSTSSKGFAFDFCSQVITLLYENNSSNSKQQVLEKNGLNNITR